MKVLYSAIGTHSQFKVSKPLSPYEHKPRLFGDLHGTPLIQLHQHLHQMPPSLTTEDCLTFSISRSLHWGHPHTFQEVSTALDFHTTPSKPPPFQLPLSTLSPSTHAPSHTPDPFCSCVHVYMGHSLCQYFSCRPRVKGRKPPKP